MSEKPSLKDHLHNTVAVVVLVALGLPTAVVLIQPVLPTLVGVAVLVLVVKLVFRGPRYRGRGGQ